MTPTPSNCTARRCITELSNPGGAATGGDGESTNVRDVAVERAEYIKSR